MKTQPVQVYLTPEQRKALREAAKRSGRSMAEIVRTLVDTQLVLTGAPPTDLSDLAGSVRLGHATDVAHNRDRMLADALGDLR